MMFLVKIFQLSVEKFQLCVSRFSSPCVADRQTNGQTRHVMRPIRTATYNDSVLTQTVDRLQDFSQ